MPDLPPPAGGPSRLHFITTRTYRLIRELLARPPLEPDAQQFETITRPQGRTFRLRIAEIFRQAASAGSSTGLISFRLTTGTNEAEALTWQVSSVRSTITDGTNGPLVDLSSAGFDTPNVIAATRYIVLKATINPTTYAATDWSLAAEEDEPEEVEFDESPDDDQQVSLRLYIGKVTIDEGVATVTQATTKPQLLDYGFANGTAVKIFIPHTLHPDYAPAS